MRLAGADAFDAMIHRADAGREEQPFRRVHGQPGIENGRARDGEGMPQPLLHMGAFVGDPCDVAELAAGDRGGHADLPHDRRLELRLLAAAGADVVDALDRRDIIGKTELHRLGAIGDRAAADGDDEIGLGVAGLVGGGNDGRARRMRGHLVEDAGAARAHRLADFCDLAGLAMQRSAHHQEGALRAEPVESARRWPPRHGVRTPPRPWRRIRHGPCARLSSRGPFLL